MVSIRGPERLDFSSPAVNGQARVGGGGAAWHPALQPGSQPQAAATRRLDAVLTEAAVGDKPGAPLVGPAPFSRRFAPPTQQPASAAARTPATQARSFPQHNLLRGVQHVREAPPSLLRMSLDTPATQRRAPAGRPPLGQVQGLFTGVKRRPPQQAPDGNQQLPQQRRSADIGLQSLSRTTRVGGGLGALHAGSSPSASQMQDAVLLRQVVDTQLRQEELQEQQRRQQRQQQRQQQAPAEEVDLTGEPSSQQPPPALHQQPRQQQQQPRGPAAGAAARLGAPEQPRRFEWRAMLRQVAAAQIDELDDMSSDVLAPARSAAEERYLKLLEESRLARRKALQADQQQVQCVQQAHTALERQHPEHAQRAELEAQQIQQQLHTLQLQRSPLAQKPSTQKRRPGAAAAAPGWQQQRAAKAAAAVEDGEAEEVLELLSSEDEGSAPCASMAAAASEEESEVSQQLERAAIAEEGPYLTIPDLWREEYEAALSPGPAGEVLVDHPLSSIQLTRRDMACMASLQWLNDEVINLYISLLLERDARRRKQGKGPRCHFFSTFFANKLYKDAGEYNYNEVRRWTVPTRLKTSGQASESILDCDRIILPVHQGLHWVCAVIDLQHRKFVYYDSLLGEDHRCLQHLAEYVRDEYKNKRGEQRDDVLDWPREFPKRIPRQRNGCDCGVFTLLFASHAGSDSPMLFTQEQMDDWRVRIVHELLTLSVA
ncbi:hypothetical protein ABPG77_002353 [Micractinium sp. CCAP 211/92]